MSAIANQPQSVRVLILYSTIDGHTRHICEHLQNRFEETGAQARLSEIGELAAQESLDGYALVVIGASIRYGFHRRAVAEFMQQRQEDLQRRLHAFFSVNLVARKPAKGSPATNPYLRHFLRRIGWQPRYLEVFAGRLDYPRCRFLDRCMIRLIMAMTGGPTDPGTVVEYTDWQRVDAFGDRLIEALRDCRGEHQNDAPA